MTPLDRSATGLPAVGWETHPWVSGIDLDLLSRRQRSLVPATYESAVPAHIASLDLALPMQVLADVEDATASLVRLDAHAAAVFGELEIGPVEAVLLRSESAASSQIEKLTVSAKQLALAELGATTSRNARLVVRNVEAMAAAIALAHRLDADALLGMHAALLPGEGGRWRDVQVWIGTSSTSPLGASFVPPHPTLVPDGIDDLVVFLARDDLPVLVQVALAHAQFETIHPFVDGNGRTGRALAHAVLRNKGVVQRVTVPVSVGLLADTSRYFAALGAYRQGDPVPIIRNFADATRVAAQLGRRLVEDLAELLVDWTARVAPRAGSAIEQALPQLVGHPAVDVAWLKERLNVSDTAARRAIDQAVAARVLTGTTDRARNRVWIAAEVIELMDAFAAQSGRRSLPGPAGSST